MAGSTWTANGVSRTLLNQPTSVAITNTRMAIDGYALRFTIYDVLAFTLSSLGNSTSMDLGSSALTKGNAGSYQFSFANGGGVSTGIYIIYDTVPLSFAAVPEPGTVGLFGLGLLVLFSLNRKRAATPSANTHWNAACK